MTAQNETQLCLYRYDALDRATGHTRLHTPETQRFYCKSRLATEIQGAAGYSIIQHDGQLLAEQRSVNNQLSTILLTTDPQRTVLHTLRFNETGHPITYSPYGHRMDKPRLLSLLGFNGERPDPVTGCYVLGNGYRAYNPVLMRFNSPDSLSPFGRGGLNSYVYCLGDPINRSDPNGHYSFKSLAIAFFTKKVKNISAPGYSKIRPGVSTRAALRAHDRLKELATMNQASVNAALFDDYVDRLTPPLDSSVKEVTRYIFFKSGNGNFDVKKLPQQIKDFVPANPSTSHDRLLDHIKENFNFKKQSIDYFLDHLINNQGTSQTPPDMIDAAKTYRGKIYNIRTQHVYPLQYKREVIVRENFLALEHNFF